MVYKDNQGNLVILESIDDVQQYLSRNLNLTELSDFINQCVSKITQDYEDTIDTLMMEIEDLKTELGDSPSKIEELKDKLQELQGCSFIFESERLECADELVDKLAERGTLYLEWDDSLQCYKVSM